MPTEYIKREAALNLIGDIPVWTGYEPTMYPGLTYDVFRGMQETATAIKAGIKAIPSAKVVERNIGTWIKRPGERICPFCNDRHSYFGGAEKKFCSECGADLRDEIS